MINLDETLELIPISTIKLIFDDDNIFRDFIMNFDNKDLFKDASFNSYINALNDYMTYFIKNNYEIPRMYFNKINYINNKYKTNIKDYNYDRYISKEKDISISFIFKILNDDNIFYKFLNYDNNKEFFNNKDIIQYLNKFDSLLAYLKESNMMLSENALNHYKMIKSKYVFYTNNNEELVGDAFTGEVNTELKNEILKDIDFNNDKFYIARNIYLNLCKKTTYDIDFLVYQEKKQKDSIESRKIYNKNIKEITPLNNKITCKSFSEIYASLLNEVGIKAVLNGSYHKYVLFSINGTIIKADGTNSKRDTLLNYDMSDFVAVKLGFKTVNFEALNNNIDLSLLIDNVDKEINEKSNKILDFEKQYRSIKNIYTNDINIESILMYISKLNTDTLDGIEYTQYIKLMLDANIKEKNKVIYSSCFRKINDNYNPLFAVLYDNLVYIISKDTLLLKLSPNEFIHYIRDDNIYIRSNTFKRKLGELIDEDINEFKISSK